MKRLLLVAATTAALCSIAFTHQPWSDAPTPSADRIDAVLGTGGFNIFCPVVPGNGIGHETQVTRRLTLIEMVLRQRDVSAWPEELRAERARNLDRLHAYRIRGEYPRNYDHPDELLPCFIDRDGRICAVGYLVERSVGRDVSEKINASHQYQTIAQIHEPVLDTWIARSGLTRAEVETIQEPESWPEEMASRTIVPETIGPRRAVAPNAAIRPQPPTTRRPEARPVPVQPSPSQQVKAPAQPKPAIE